MHRFLRDGPDTWSRRYANGDLSAHLLRSVHQTNATVRQDSVDVCQASSSQFVQIQEFLLPLRTRKGFRLNPPQLHDPGLETGAA